MMTEWIGLKERLPEQDIDIRCNGKRKAIKVLTAAKNAKGWTIRTKVRFWSWDAKSWIWRDPSGGITHWMPLPEPPEDEI